MTRICTARASLLAALLLPGLAAAAGLNDTGIMQCADDDENNLTCPQEPNFPRQDADIGRDAQATASPITLSKAGGGSAGFDFTKLDSNGNPLSAEADSWDCVRDNVTGLIWEVKTDDGGLRDKDWTYTWYNTDPNTNGGFEGVQDGGLCSSGGVGFPEHCNTQAYVAAVNTADLCGYNTGWRMPTREELHSIVDYSISVPVIDANFFPNTPSSRYWSASPYAPDANVAWIVSFTYGTSDAFIKGDISAVRLVRGGQ